MKILVLHNRYRQAGGEDVAVELETGLLKEQGHAVELLIFDNDELTLKDAPSALYNRSSYFKVRDLILHFKPDIVHVHNTFFEASPSVLSAASDCRIPVVMTLHNYRLICCNGMLLRDQKPCTLCVQRNFPRFGVQYRCYRDSRAASALVTAITGYHKLKGTWKKKVARYVVLTEFAKQRMVDSSLKAPASHFNVLPHFVEDPGPNQQTREDYFLFAGRISPEKGVALILQAAAQLPDLEFRIVGEGPELESLRRQYAALANVHFMGHLNRTELRMQMQKARALLFTSVWYETMGFTNLEAFSCGTPVIASRLGVMQEVIENNYNGLHFTAGDAADLARAVKVMHEHHGYAQLSANARLTYESKYSAAAHYQGLMEVYQQALTQTSSY